MAVSKTVTGLKKETSGALAYVLGPITGVLFLIIERDPFVRFHAMQSIVASVLYMAINWFLTLAIFTVILAPIAVALKGIVVILGFVGYLMLIYKAWQGEEWELPYVGKLARQFVKKV
jgi:uncharacterized membrane protein